MNSLELNTTLDVFGIEEDKLNGITVYFSGTYYSVISGQIPYAVAKIMSKKYPAFRDDIRINGNYGYGKVRDKRQYAKDDLGNSYVDCYHIDSKEGLIYLLSEIQYYHTTGGIYTEKLRKSHYKRQREILAEVNRRLIEYGNPYKTTEEWLTDHNMVEVGNNSDAIEILPYLKEFDNAINPFSNA